MTKAVAIKPPKHVAEFMSNIGMIPVAELIKLPADQRFDHAALGAKTELAGVLYTGFALMGLKDEVGHGNYLKELGDRTIAPKQAERAVNLAKLSTRMDESNWTTLSYLPPSKLLIVSRFNDEELIGFLSGEAVRGITLENVQLEPVRELERRMKAESELARELKQENNHLRDYIGRLERDVEKLSARDAWRGEMPRSVLACRTDGTGRAGMAIQCLSELEALLHLVLQGRDLHADEERRHAELSEAISVLSVCANAIVAKAAHLQHEINTLASDWLPTDSTPPMLTDGEADIALEAFRLLIDRDDFRALSLLTK